jgi:hypothetical protein
VQVRHRQYEATPSAISRQLVVAVQIIENGAHLCLREKLSENKKICDVRYRVHVAALTTAVLTDSSYYFYEKSTHETT